MTDKILSSHQDGVAHIQFNNPARRNAVSLEMWQAVGRALDGFAADQRVRVLVLSGAGDKAFVSGAKMYPKTGGTTSDAVELHVNAKRRKQASIGKVGEEDLYRFMAQADGRYMIDTLGPTDVVMKLFGPNSETALIAEDDDSGLDTNARIASNLTAGEYFVQVRHYSRQSGTGKYSIKVREL